MVKLVYTYNHRRWSSSLQRKVILTITESVCDDGDADDDDNYRGARWQLPKMPTDDIRRHIRAHKTISSEPIFIAIVMAIVMVATEIRASVQPLPRFRSVPCNRMICRRRNRAQRVRQFPKFRIPCLKVNPIFGTRSPSSSSNELQLSIVKITGCRPCRSSSTGSMANYIILIVTLRCLMLLLI